MWQPWKCASQISHCRKHFLSDSPSCCARNQGYAFHQPLPAKDWAQTAEILMQAYCWDSGLLWWATLACGLLVSLAETLRINCPTAQIFPVQPSFPPSLLSTGLRPTVQPDGSPSLIQIPANSLPQLNSRTAHLVPSWHQLLRKPETIYHELTQISIIQSNITGLTVVFFLSIFIPPFSDCEKPGLHYP